MWARRFYDGGLAEAAEALVQCAVTLTLCRWIVWSEGLWLALILPVCPLVLAASVTLCSQVGPGVLQSAVMGRWRRTLVPLRSVAEVLVGRLVGWFRCWWSFVQRRMMMTVSVGCPTLPGNPLVRGDGTVGENLGDFGSCCRTVG